MRKVKLRMNEQEKYEIIKELAINNGNKNRASKKLGISRRQVDRLIINIRRKVNQHLYMATAQRNQSML